VKKIFKNFILTLMGCGLCVANLSCSGNFYKAASQTDSPNALIEDAKNALDDLDYDTAITKMLTLQTNDSTAYLNCATVDGVRSCPRELLAGAYAGRCGFTLLPFIASISSSSGAVFKFLMNSFTSVTVVPADCYSAQQVMETFTVSQLNSDQKIFLALLGMAKMGVYLRNSADTDKDGVTDAAFDACNTAKISDADVKQVVTGMGLFITYSAALSSTGSATSSLTTINTVCGALGIDCSITDPNSAAITAGVVAAFRDLIKSTDYGVETACGNYTPACCP